VTHRTLWGVLTGTGSPKVFDTKQGVIGASHS